jgi:hypothetical protein
MTQQQLLNLLAARDHATQELNRLERLIQYAKRRSDKIAQRRRLAQDLIEDFNKVQP